MSPASARQTGRGTGDAGHDAPTKQAAAGVTTIWLVGGAAIAVAAIALMVTWLRGGPRGDLGTVSSHWISEHRLGSNQDYSRR